MSEALTWPMLALLMGTLTALAALPSVSSLAVATRAASGGFAQGVWLALGVLAGDLIFILIALFGIVGFAAALGPWYPVLQVLGGLYLCGLAILILRGHRADPAGTEAGLSAGSGGSLVSGLLLTLGDQKAIVFYLGFFPALVEPAALSGADVLTICLVALVAVGIPKLGYAWMGQKTSDLLSPKLQRGLVVLAGALLLAAGLILLLGAVGIELSTRTQ